MSPPARDQVPISDSHPNFKGAQQFFNEGRAPSNKGDPNYGPINRESNLMLNNFQQNIRNAEGEDLRVFVENEEGTGWPGENSQMSADMRKVNRNSQRETKGLHYLQVSK